jgi:hypothetical protein
MSNFFEDINNSKNKKDRYLNQRQTKKMKKKRKKHR